MHIYTYIYICVYTHTHVFSRRVHEDLRGDIGIQFRDNTAENNRSSGIEMRLKSKLVLLRVDWRCNLRKSKQVDIVAPDSLYD